MSDPPRFRSVDPTVLVEAAWRAVECSAPWQAEFERLTRRLDPHKAIVAMARKLLVGIWHVLHEQAADPHANADLVAFKFTHAVQCSRGLVLEVDRRATRWTDHAPVRARRGTARDRARPRSAATQTGTARGLRAAAGLSGH